MNTTNDLTLEALKLEFEDYKATMSENMDNFFVVTVSIIIYLMQCGFAFLEAGSVRAKNTVNILIKNLLDTFVSGSSYWLVGYAFAFGRGNPFIGHCYFNFFEPENEPFTNDHLCYFAHAHLEDTKLAHWFFQFVFAATAATIVSGAVAERCDFNAYLVYSFILTGFVYPVVTHWAWAEGGWLYEGVSYYGHAVTFQDFGGSGVVHTVGGVVAFVGALCLGPRLGRFSDDGQPRDIRGHSLPLAALGGFILLFGFFAFNGGSQGEISSPGAGIAVARSIVNTVLAATGGGFTTLLMNKTGLFGDGKWSLLTSLNGCLAGMVSVCAGCNSMYSYGGFVTGILGGFSYLIWSWIVIRLKVDDPLDATAVHFGGGLTGILTVPFLDMKHGILYNGDAASGVHFAWNLAGLLAIIAWSGICATLIFLPLRLTGILRVSEEFEENGLDIPKHNEEAYPVGSQSHGWGDGNDNLKKLLGLGSMLGSAATSKKNSMDISMLTRSSAANSKKNSIDFSMHARNNSGYINGETTCTKI